MEDALDLDGLGAKHEFDKSIIATTWNMEQHETTTMYYKKPVMSLCCDEVSKDSITLPALCKQVKLAPGEQKLDDNLRRHQHWISIP